MTQVIIGAGMAGLLAARMLRHLSPVVYERQGSLPHNHSAVLRFRTGTVGDVLGIPFKRVLMTKTVIPWQNPVADALAYSLKVIEEYRTDRSVLLPERWETSERWIAPEDLVERMADGVDVKFNRPYEFPANEPKVISTIPMPYLARAMGYEERVDWRWVRGTNVNARIKNCEAYASVMVPNPGLPFYRASITGNLLTIECTGAPDDQDERMVDQACRLLGIRYGLISEIRRKEQDFAKIAPIPEDQRRNFIYWASTVKGRAYQLGRYATWRPRLMMDDLIKDVRLVGQWIQSPSRLYDQEEHERRAQRA